VTGFAEVGRFREAVAWLEEYRESYRAGANRAIRLSEAVEYAVAHPADDESLAAFIEDATRTGLVPLPDALRNEPLWKRAATYRLPATARALGCPPEELSKIVPRSAEELLLAAACKPESHDLFVAMASRLLQESPDPRGTASRLLGALTGNVLLHPTTTALDFLLERGADVDAEQPWRQGSFLTPLQALVFRNDLDLAALLLARGADINHVTRDSGMTALEIAVGSGRLVTVRWVLERGATIQEQRTGRPLLRVALALGEWSAEGDEIVAELLARGADPYLRSRTDGRSAVDVLAEQRDILRLLRLDVRGEHRSLTGAYVPAPNSPFTGVWTNRKDGFDTVSLLLAPDGLALLAGAVSGAGFFPWRATGPDTVVIEAARSELRTDIEAVLAPAEGVLRVKVPGAPSAIALRRSPEKAPTAEELARKLKEERKPRREEPRPRWSFVGEPDYAPTTRDLLLPGRGLQELDPRIGAMTGLRTLGLTDNRLRALPDWLAGMKELTALGLAENWLNSLPPWFPGLAGLESLSLEMNAFREFPAEVRPLKKLRELNLSHNQLSSLPPWWGEFPALSQLFLEGNQLSHLPEGCSGLRSLGTLRLANNRLTALPDCLLQLPKLGTVYLQGNPIPAAEQERLKRDAPKTRWVF
jgi:hypothetical protein